MTGTYRIAEQNIRITSLYPDVQNYCAAYRTAEAPTLFVETSPADIERERARSDRETVTSDPELEKLAVYRQIAEQMPARDTLLFHGSALAVDGAAYLFTAASGTGKSTHARLWRELLGERVVMVNDDKPLLRVTEGGALVYGTPWDGKHRLSRNVAVPLKALCLLERAAENRIAPLSPRAAYPLLVQQAYRPADPAALAQTLALLDRLSARVRLFRLGCNMELAAARLAYETLRK